MEAKNNTGPSFPFGKYSSPHVPIDISSSSSSSSSSSDDDTDKENDLSTENASNQLVLYDPMTDGSKAIGLLPNRLHYESPLDPIRKSQELIPRVLPSVGAFTVQCANCFKWRLIPTQEKYEEIREHILEWPFSCETAREWRPNVSCDDPEDISQDGSRLWAIDKPSIAQPPPGWKREVRIRGEGSYKFADIYYTAPSGKKLRSTVEIQKYLLKHPEYAIDGLTLSRFSFLTPKPLQENYVRKRPALTTTYKGNGPAQFEIANPLPLSWVVTTNAGTESLNVRTVLPLSPMDSSNIRTVLPPSPMDSSNVRTVLPPSPMDSSNVRTVLPPSPMDSSNVWTVLPPSPMDSSAVDPLSHPAKKQQTTQRSFQQGIQK